MEAAPKTAPTSEQFLKIRATTGACPACKNPECQCVCCEGEGWTRDEETGEVEGCLVCNGEYWGNRR